MSPTPPRPRLAIGPVMPGWGSWEWVGLGLVDGLAGAFETQTFAAWELPDAEAVVVVKHAPPPDWVAAAAARAPVLYCPIDAYGDPADIAADAGWLRRCARIVVHSTRLRPLFEPFAPTVYLDHPLKFATPTRAAFRPAGRLLWVGVRANLPPLVAWVNAHPLPAPLDVLTNPERPGAVPTPAALGFRPGRDVRVHEWTPDRHRQFTAAAWAALDVKGADFRSRHKPPAKALDFVASGVPVALDPGGSAAEHLAGLGLAVPSPADPARWLSEDYWRETRRVGAGLTESLAGPRVAAEAGRLVRAALADRRPARAAGAAVARPTPRVYGLMVTTDDQAVFGDWCRDQLGLYDAVVCVDGSAGDATARIAARYADRLVYLREADLAPAARTNHGLRRAAHAEIVRRFGPGHWVMCCHPDEFCYHDPRAAAARAAAEGCDHVQWLVPHFLPHPTEWADWPRRRHLVIPDRYRHYHWDHRGSGLPWVEDRLYRDGPGVGWDDRAHDTVRPRGLLRPAPFRPILRHFKVLEPDPSRYAVAGDTSRPLGRWEGAPARPGLPFPVRRPEDFFVAALPGYGRCDRFDGAFPHPWNLGDEYRPAAAPPAGPAGGAAEPNPAAVGAPRRPTRVAVLSLLFNWPSTGGGNVHTAELTKFLAAAGYEVRHLFARFAPWGIGRVAAPTPFPATAVEFAPADWTADRIVARFRGAVDRFDPDHVLLTDSWNLKPVLAAAAGGRPYVLRLQALECLCPLNNVRLVPGPDGRPAQCTRHQLATPDECARCVQLHGPTSGDLHRAERGLAGVGSAAYREALYGAFAGAEAVLVVNPLTAAMVEPYARAVRVVTAGMDPARFPYPFPPDRAAPRTPGRARVLFAGLTREWMKGFAVLREAARRLRQTRDDFEVVATDDPPDGEPGGDARYVGWQAQEDLPAHLAGADVVALPTVAQEALGRTAVEAMAAGRPVVASRLGGLPFTVADEATGLLAEPGDPADLAAKLARLLDDPALRARLGAAGRRRFEDHYAWEVIVRRHYLPIFGTP